MDIKNKNTKNKKLSMMLIFAGVVLFAVIVAGFVFRDEIKTIATNVTTSIENRDKPKFVLGSTQFSDWASSGNTYQDGSQDDAAIVTMSMQQCASGSHCSNLVEECRSNHQCEKLDQLSRAGHCMVHFYYFDRPINPDEAIADFIKTNAGFKVDTREIAAKTLSMNTPEGDKTYQLHQYDSGNTSGNYKSGISLGYISLESSHIEVLGICNASSQLDEVLPVLNVVRLAP